MSADPVSLVRDALEARGCRPHGRQYDFRARCPVHDGDNPQSLHVTIGVDGRAVVYCFARRCPVEAIASALGLAVTDMFPDGHRRGERVSLRPVRRTDFIGPSLNVVNVLFALERLREPWTLMLACVCPACGAPGAWLRADATSVDVDCPEGCDADRFTGGLVSRLNGAEAAR
jgi:hypothetical protein